MKRFTSDASHELRTPLAAIRALGEVALRSQTANHEEVISNILEETARLQSLCESLLNLSRADSGSVNLKMQSINAYDFLTETSNVLSVLAEEKGQILKVQADKSITASVDPHFFRQAIMNLIDNAIKYSHDGATIIVQAKAANGKVLFSIKDNGPGIADEHQEKIFERFYRIDTARSRATGGAGLGLSICSWIIQKHKGSIQLESNLGQGSEFLISI